MKDLLTILTCAIGERMERNNENILYESLKINKDTGKDIWKIDVINEYITTHISMHSKELVKRCIELAKDFNLGDAFYKENYWKHIIADISVDIAKKKAEAEIKKASKTIRSTATLGCGGSSSYSSGCGGSSSYSRRSYSSGCGGGYRRSGC